MENFYFMCGMIMFLCFLIIIPKIASMIILGFLLTAVLSLAVAKFYVERQEKKNK